MRSGYVRLGALALVVCLAVGCGGDPQVSSEVNADDPVAPPSAVAVTNSEELDFARKRVRRIMEMERRGNLTFDTLRYTCTDKGDAGYYVRSLLGNDLVRVVRYDGSLPPGQSQQSAYYLEEGLIYAVQLRAPDGQREYAEYYYEGNLLAREGEAVREVYPRAQFLAAALAGRPPCD